MKAGKKGKDAANQYGRRGILRLPVFVRAEETLNTIRYITKKI